jgi:valyl-tRNA synthetase
LTKQRVITSPVRLTGSVHPEQLASLVCADAFVRRQGQIGDEPVEWQLSALTGDAAVQRAVERAMAREGDQREEVGREGFAVRTQFLEREAEGGLRELLNALDIQASLDRWGLDGEEPLRAARVAFVRLYEAGLLTLDDTVVDSCPSCESVVDEIDTDTVEVEVDQLHLTLTRSDGQSLLVEVNEPELMVGAVAVAVPPDSPALGTSVFVPLIEKELPVIAVEGVEMARLVEPGHDLWSYEVARQSKFSIIEVLDGEGVVRHPGLLEGLGRYAARSAATEHLLSEGYVTAHAPQQCAVKRCHRCGTTLVPLYGRHWLLNFRLLADAVIEKIEGGAIVFSPVNTADQLLSKAQTCGEWVISQQLWSGRPIPVSTCLDCGQMEVSVDDAGTCKSCMGTLVAHDDVLDARFIAAITPLAMLGWPNAMEDVAETVTTLLIGRTGLEIWALPIAALGLRLSDQIPFQQLVVHQTPVGVADPGQQIIREMLDWAGRLGVQGARAALLSGDLGTERAEQMLSALHEPKTAPNDDPLLVERFDKSLLDMDAGGALATLLGGAQEGIGPNTTSAWPQLVKALLT